MPLYFVNVGVVNETEAHKDVNLLPDFGLFEASHMACPILPQYHPKQLMELLNSGKIRGSNSVGQGNISTFGQVYRRRIRIKIQNKHNGFLQ